jgi:hypothetical protein
MNNKQLVFHHSSFCLAFILSILSILFRFPRSYTEQLPALEANY